MWKREWKVLAVIAAVFAACFWLPVGVPRFDAAVHEALALIRWHAREHVVTVCDNAAERCPVFPRGTTCLHVGFDDPPRLAKGCKTEDGRLQCYRRVRDEIRAFVSTLPGRLKGGLDTIVVA